MGWDIQSVLSHLNIKQKLNFKKLLIKMEQFNQAKEMNMEKVSDNQGTLGRLKFVTKVKKQFVCRECQNKIEIGSPCFTQSDYRGQDFFPVQTRLCVNCGKSQIEKGIEIKNQELYNKNLK